MHTQETSRAGEILDSVLAKICLNCPACRRARRLQHGAAFWLVRRVERHVCPFCRAYERTFGQPAHQPLVPPRDSL